MAPWGCSPDPSHHGDRLIGMAENKTQQNDGDVGAFLESVDNDRRRQDAEAVLEMMERISGEPPTM